MSDPTQQWTITAETLLKDTKPKFWLDVRQPEEYEESHIPGSVLIPLGEIMDRASELKKDQDIVIYCAHGMRSFEALIGLRQLGFTRLKSLEGGIHAWAEAGGEVR